MKIVKKYIFKKRGKNKMNNFKTLFKNSLLPFVEMDYITKEEANEIYLHILKHSKELDRVKTISIDNSESISGINYKDLGNTHGSPKGIYRSHNDNMRNGNGNTIILRGLKDNRVLRVGKKIEAKNIMGTVEILEATSLEDGINQRVKVKTQKGVTINSFKHLLLGL